MHSGNLDDIAATAQEACEFLRDCLNLANKQVTHILHAVNNSAGL